MSISMKKILVISVVSIVLIVSGYNIFQYLNGYGIKINYSTDIEIAKSEVEHNYNNGDKKVKAALLLGQFLFLIFYCVRVVMFHYRNIINRDKLSYAEYNDGFLKYVFIGTSDMDVGTNIIGMFWITLNGILMFVWLTKYISNHL